MKYHVSLEDLKLDVNVTGYLEAKVKGQEQKVDLVRLDDVRFSAIIEHKSYIFELQKKDDEYFIQYKNRRIPVTIETDKDVLLKQLKKASGADSGKSDVKAPMPGLVVRLDVVVGQSVTKGQGILILEAMKMENEIKAPVNGTITNIMVSEKQSVEKNAILLSIG